MKIACILLITLTCCAMLGPVAVFGKEIGEKKSLHIAAIPNDPYFNSQDYLRDIKLPDAWDVTTGSREVVVAVIDAGVDYTHEDIKNNSWVNAKEISGNNKDDDNNGYTDDVHGWDFVTSTNNVMPRNGTNPVANQHGTVIAGIIAAVGNNELGIAGVAWKVRVMAIRALDDDGKGYASDVAKAIRYAADNGARVINLSFVSDDSSNASTMTDAIVYARSKSVLVVAAAGNDALDLNTSPRYPVCTPGVIGVASVALDGSKSAFTNYGNNCIDVSAYGEGIVSTVSPGKGLESAPGYSAGWAGTSMSAPLVSGVAALVISHKFCLANSQIETLLSTDAVTPFVETNMELGAGIIDASKAVSNVLSSTCILALPSIQRSQDQIKEFFLDERASRSGKTNSAVGKPQSVTIGDVDNDGSRDILIGTLKKTNESFIYIYGQDLSLKKSFKAFSKSSKEISIAVGDIDGDGIKEILASQGEGLRNEIRVFSFSGSIKKRIFPYTASYNGGLRIAACDLTHDGVDEILIGGGKRALPRVSVLTGDGKTVITYLAYAKSFRDGITVSCGDVQGDSTPEIITAPLRGGGPQVRIFSNEGTPITSFFSYSQKFRGGVELSLADINADGFQDIITAPSSGGGPNVRIFTHTGSLVTQFNAFAQTMNSGLRVAAL